MNRATLTDAERAMSLEDRREARKELLLRYLTDNPQAARRIAQPQTVARWSRERGSERVGAYQSDYAAVAGYTAAEQAMANADVPPVVKRSRMARVDSMIERLQTLPPALLEAKLQEIAGEFWKQGMPVTGEALRAVAAKYLNQVERRHPQYRTPEGR